ncbi:MAG: hypothetical protein ABI432_00345 [Flavobacteriales bacterium]
MNLLGWCFVFKLMDWLGAILLCVFAGLVIVTVQYFSSPAKRNTLAVISATKAVRKNWRIARPTGTEEVTSETGREQSIRNHNRFALAVFVERMMRAFGTEGEITAATYQGLPVYPCLAWIKNDTSERPEDRWQGFAEWTRHLTDTIEQYIFLRHFGLGLSGTYRRSVALNTLLVHIEQVVKVHDALAADSASAACLQYLPSHNHPSEYFTITTLAGLVPSEVEELMTAMSALKQAWYDWECLTR